PRLGYAIDRLLGKGGFGQVYLARRLGRSSSVAEVICVKASTRIDGWLREAYFGQLLHGHPRAIRVYDAFPLIRPDGQVLYCLTLEYARHGDLETFLRRAGTGWPEKTVRREIAGILEVLGRLHRGQVLHRDLTPLNVFVCEGPSLKLGDFGIARHQSDGRGITARTMNVMTAARAARRAGAIVHGGPSMRTTVVVRGRPNAQQAAGKDAGLKLLEIKRLAEKGHEIKLLDERRFWRLVAGTRVRRTEP